ncbi:hypothetical protein NKG94_05540 [Micromonospora sp. M12]
MVLTVSDEGPGMPAGAIRRGASAAGSTGLGWTSPGAPHRPPAVVWSCGPALAAARVLLRLGPPTSEREA